MDNLSLIYIIRHKIFNKKIVIFSDEKKTKQICCWIEIALILNIYLVAFLFLSTRWEKNIYLDSISRLIIYLYLISFSNLLIVFFFLLNEQYSLFYFNRTSIYSLEWNSPHMVLDFINRKMIEFYRCISIDLSGRVSASIRLFAFNWFLWTLSKHVRISYQ